MLKYMLLLETKMKVRGLTVDLERSTSKILFNP